ncbi:MipA/OmpV family protein [Jannaschia seohaensis]|uniref:Outer membrane scaffolding protein for murein synthesis (MipA/OmpV family) n=1 Tax=Jannaschia seohaensis TaxID=475081 RepID=A0A2Y9C0R3_9RHOB|nr:MipA/OmpV family protein [Jannaschia seohaensis]PWJ18197.1 outer membrane scaffolding protein for murein synthesis (MipA/OmpV family) [Jannaschia seohaensis]SSA46722.1 Outer membrane scaffolding protein for murein synthesis, MipA/OmpV family [Jannaschia seohaensis]
MLRTIAALACLAPAAALAQSTDFAAPVDGPALGFTLRGGVGTAPTYFGSDSNEAVPDIGFEFDYLNLGGFTFGDPDPLYRPQGFGFGGSLRYIGERDASDYDELTGLDDVDASLELGVGVSYSGANYEIFGNVRYGVIGHEGFVGELGADALIFPTDRLTLRAGPRAFFGDDTYASTYFGVTGAEAAASGGNLSAFEADGGLLSTGVEFGAGYRINDNWGIDAAITYERLRNSAEDSPISLDDDQISARIGLTRRFTLGF